MPDYETMVDSRGSTIAPDDRESAIYPYSAATWVNQFTNRLNPVIDLRDGTRLGAIFTPSDQPGAVPAASSPTGFVQVPLTFVAGAGAYLLNLAAATDAAAAPGTRAEGIAAQFQYHVLNPNQDPASYAAARALVGTGSSLAGGAFTSTIRGRGYVALASATIGDPREPGAAGEVRRVTARTPA